MVAVVLMFTGDSCEVLQQDQGWQRVLEAGDCLLPVPFALQDEEHVLTRQRGHREGNRSRQMGCTPKLVSALPG